ncbi:hypothetical protein E2C01_077625 [Portunus trituberculatus]|uniref:Uncharacterized protein n=1 Tax=Portunus trituberculatus TaxID=210409 RepID=A0A5B7IMU2_PORTR|nr:hypothetical protein [Portunus trituberculatus]
MAADLFPGPPETSQPGGRGGSGGVSRWWGRGEVKVGAAVAVVAMVVVIDGDDCSGGEFGNSSGGGGGGRRL